MSHEPWPNCLFPIDRVSASRRASKVRSSISWRSLLEELFLLGSVSRHWEQTQDLGISALGTRGLHRTERDLDSKTTKTVYDRIWQSPLKARSYGLSAKPACCGTGSRIQTAEGSRTFFPSDLSSNFRRIRTHGARRTGSDSGFESTTPPPLAVLHSTFLRSITSRPISGWIRCARNR